MARLIGIIGPRKENDSQGRYITPLTNRLLHCGDGNSSSTMPFSCWDFLTNWTMLNMNIVHFATMPLTSGNFVIIIYSTNPYASMFVELGSTLGRGAPCKPIFLGKDLSHSPFQKGSKGVGFMYVGLKWEFSTPFIIWAVGSDEELSRPVNNCGIWRLLFFKLELRGKFYKRYKWRFTSHLNDRII